MKETVFRGFFFQWDFKQRHDGVVNVFPFLHAIAPDFWTQSFCRASDKWWAQSPLFHSKIYEARNRNGYEQQKISGRGEYESPWNRELFHCSSARLALRHRKPVCYFNTSYQATLFEVGPLKEKNISQREADEAFLYGTVGGKDFLPAKVLHPITKYLDHSAVILDLANGRGPLFDMVKAKCPDFFRIITTGEGEQTIRLSHVLSWLAWRYGCQAIAWKSVRMPLETDYRSVDSCMNLVVYSTIAIRDKPP